MSAQDKPTVYVVKSKKKSKGVRGPPHYITHPTGTINTCVQSLNTKAALSAVISQLKEKSREKFLSETNPGDLSPSPCDGAGDKSDDSQHLDEAMSRSLTGSGGDTLRHSITKRWAQLGHLDTDSASDGSLNKYWDNGGDIATGSYM